MIQRMKRGENLLSAITLVLSLTGFLVEPTLLIAGDSTRFWLPDQLGGLTIRVYGFPGLSPWVLKGAETEAARMLQSAAIQLNWMDCTSLAVSASCLSPRQSTDLTIRFLSKALPRATVSTLGTAASSGDAAVAFIFYDRVMAMRTHTRLLPAILGRVMAHEITHLLLPQEDHSEIGLMRAQWAADDLRLTSSACLGLSMKSVQLMQREVLRRVVATHGGLEK
jgi:hypothetical protein